MTRLEELNIAGTDIDSGWECLSGNIHIFYCFAENNPKSRSEAIANELRKYGKTNEDKDRDDNFAILLGRWREEKSKEEKEQVLRKAEEKRIVTLLIPVEKLLTIRNNIEKFLDKDKWSKEKLEGLKTIQELEKYNKLIEYSQWGGRFAAATGGVLSLTGQSTVGGSIGVICPLIESLASYYETKNEEKKKEWDEFAQDTEKIWYTYRELVDILKNIKEEFIVGEIKEVLGDLKNKTYDFLKEYDADKNNQIDDDEWKIAKEKFPHDLRSNWIKRINELEKIKVATEKLENEVIDYRNSDEVINRAKARQKDEQKEMNEKDQQYEAHTEIPPKSSLEITVLK